MSPFHESPFDCLSLCNQALNSPCGVGLLFDKPHQAKQWRRRIYNWRDQQRANGNNDYDCLSVVLGDSGELKVLKRASVALSNKPKLDAYTYELTRADLPKVVYARGKSSVGTMFN